MRSLLTVVGFFSLSIFVSPVSAQNISPTEQNGIKATCSWKLTTYGPADYYRCVNEKTQALQRTPSPDLSDINSSDVEAIKSTCSWKWNAYGPADYYQCVDSKAKELRWTIQPNVSGISSSDLEAIKSTCSWKWNVYGPADYYQCVDSKAKELRGKSQPSVSGIDDKAPAEPRAPKEQSGFISSIQGVMGILGYYEGKPNGIYDQQTLDAIRTYQKDRGLSPDDRIGKATRDQLVKDIALALNGNRASNDHDKYDIDVTRAVINGTVGERVFDFPKKSQVQLPDLKALFKEIDENQKAIDKIKENYAGSQSEEETEFEGDGRVKKRELNEYTFFYLNGQEVTTRVKKDGKELSAEDQKKENEKTRKRIEELQKREVKKEAKEEKAKQDGKSEEKDEPGIEVFLRACQFVNPRRERFRGQDVLVFDFEPNPEFKPHKMVEKFAQKLAGVVWIDEKAHDVARLEAYFTGDMKIAGGLLANLQKGTSFVFEQAFVNNEVWLPTYMEAHIGVRFLLVKGMKIGVVTRYWDYKKFNVETLSTIAKPKAAEVPPADPTKPL
jgi:hypothetical protein